MKGPFFSSSAGSSGCFLGQYLLRLVVDVLMVSHVANNLGWCHEPLAVVVGDLETKLVLHGHDHLNMVE